MEKFDWLRRFTEEKFSKQYTRRELLKKIPPAAALLLGSAMLSREMFTRYLVNAEPVPRAVKSRLPGQPSTPLIQPSVDIAAENRKPGSTRWKITKPAGNRLQGYSVTESVVPGEWITFFVHSRKPYRMEIYRMGWYQGRGGRHMKTITGLKAIQQNLKPDPVTLAADWVPSKAIRIPRDWPTGVYLNKLVDEDGYESYIFFVVREARPTAELAVLLATNTYQAYNNWGGKSLYGYNSTGGVQAHTVSLNRPFRHYYGAGLFFQFEYNLVRWLEKEGYSLTYLTDMDLHNRVLENANVRALVIAGHSEYWSMEMRESVESLTASSINLAVFSANCAYWQVRLEPDSAGRPNRVMVSYKQYAAKDPYLKTDPRRTTCLWRESPVNMPEDRMFGIMYSGIPESPKPLVVSRAGHWLYEGTGLRNGDRIPGVVGGEVDTYRGQLPGVEVVASSPVILYGEPGYSHVTWWQKPTGGKVFAVGTFYWNWFLDPIHYENRARAHPAIQRITKNALRELLKPNHA